MSETAAVFWGTSCALASTDRVEANWDAYSPLVAAALDQAPIVGEDLACIYERIMNGHAFLLEIFSGEGLHAVAVVDLSRSVEGQLLHVHTLGGEGMEFWLDTLIDYLAEMARGLDCIGVTCTGRMGWQRALKEYGFEPQYINMKLGVEHEHRR